MDLTPNPVLGTYPISSVAIRETSVVVWLCRQLFPQLYNLMQPATSTSLAPALAAPPREASGQERVRLHENSLSLEIATQKSHVSTTTLYQCHEMELITRDSIYFRPANTFLTSNFQERKIPQAGDHLPLNI